MISAVYGSTASPAQVKNHWLLSLYAIIPACFCLAFIDFVFFGFTLRDIYLPSDPSELLFWAVIFNFPHIVSSFITLADKEYFSFYKTRLIKAFFIISTFVLLVNYAIPLVFSNTQSALLFIGFFLFFSSYTMWHVLSQQFGIGMMMMRTPHTTLYQIWRSFSTIAGTIMYFMVFGKSVLNQFTWFGMPAAEAANVVAIITVLIASLSGLILLRHSQQQIGTLYMIANLTILPAALIFLQMGYELFVIVIPRFVHDLTAFMIYSVHDHNRNLEVKHNLIYRFFSFLPITPLLLCPILAIMLANTIECGAFLADYSLGFDAHTSGECFLAQAYPKGSSNELPNSMRIWLQIMFISGFFHYYLESFVWKRDAVHRHSVKFG